MKRALIYWVAVASLAATPGMAQAPPAQRWWLGVGVGGAAVQSLAPAPSAGRGAVAASLDFGYRLTPQWGVGLDFGAVAPVSGCADWNCAGTPAAFAPDFTHIQAFSEYRPRNSGWRFRAGVGVSRFCYRSHWSDTAWSWSDTFDAALMLLNGDSSDETVGGSGGYRCDARMNALGGVVSVGYDWPVAANAPVSMGLRLSAEAADFRDTPAIGLPAFRHQAVMLTLHLDIN